MSDLNGVAHVILTAGDFARSTAFWRDMIGYLGLKLVLDSDAMLYGVGGRTAIGIRVFEEMTNAGYDFAYPTQTTFTAAPDGTMILPYAESVTMKTPKPTASPRSTPPSDPDGSGVGLGL